MGRFLNIFMAGLLELNGAQNVRWCRVHYTHQQFMFLSLKTWIYQPVMNSDKANKYVKRWYYSWKLDIYFYAEVQGWRNRFNYFRRKYWYWIFVSPHMSASCFSVKESKRPDVNFIIWVLCKKNNLAPYGEHFQLTNQPNSKTTIQPTLY